MRQENFLNDLSKLLCVEVTELNYDFDLHRCGSWDSLSVVSTIALLDEHFGANVGMQELESCRTVADLISLVGGA